MLTSLDDISDLLLDDLVKGIPGGTSGLRLGDVGKQGWNLLREDLPLPVAVLKADVLDRNDRWMAAFLAESGAVIAPHGKTTMSPQLFDGQIRHGAWAITVATVAQLQVARRFGHRRIILANQPVGRQAIRYIVDEVAGDPELELYVLADSLHGARALADEAERRQSPLPVSLLLEGGVKGGRTGCRDFEQAMELARAIKGRNPWLALRGIEGFEGLIQGATEDERTQKATVFIDFLGDIAKACQAEDLFAPGPVILSAGGSTYYDIVVERFALAGIRDARLVTRSGCYLSQDSALYADAFKGVRTRSATARGISGGLAPALEVWTYVQSLPEPGKVVLTAGRRDLSHDAGLPVPQTLFRPGSDGPPQAVGAGVATLRLHDQHAELTVPHGCDWRVGDMVSLGISHPCTTFDKWQLMFLVDDAYNVTGAVRTFF
ncbi:MAG: amino acid deaminase [Hyphomicrobiales bacterium]